MKSLIAIGLGCSLVSGVAAADPDSAGVTESATRERAISINLDPGGVIQGYYGGNAEWLHGSHGVLVEANYFRKGDDDSSISGFGGTLGYRWHWRGHQNSGFLGVNASVGVGTAATTTMDSAGMSQTWDLSVRTIAVTGNIGKRWQLDNGLNITARIGAGWASRTATTSSDDPTAKEAAEDVEDLLAFLPVAFDGELSLGYSF
jgi:hypothetical protein